MSHEYLPAPRVAIFQRDFSNEGRPPYDLVVGESRAKSNNPWFSNPGLTYAHAFLWKKRRLVVCSVYPQGTPCKWRDMTDKSGAWQSYTSTMSTAHHTSASVAFKDKLWVMGGRTTVRLYARAKTYRL